LKPTAIEYTEEIIEIPVRSRLDSQIIPCRPSFGFESFGEGEHIRNDPLNDFDFFNKRPSFAPQEQAGASNEEWIDCHNSFINYLGKLNKIVGGFQ
jgi:hypothetical protein